MSASPNAIAPTRAASGKPGGSTPRTSCTRSAISGVSAETIPITPTAAAAQASKDSASGSAASRAQRSASPARRTSRTGTTSASRSCANNAARRDPGVAERALPLPRWVTPLLTTRRRRAAAVDAVAHVLAPVPATSRTHYDLAWVGFDIALAAAFAGTSWAAMRSSAWLVPLAAVTGTMLVCDAWFDVVTSIGSGDDRRGGARGGVRRAAARRASASTSSSTRSRSSRRPCTATPPPSSGCAARPSARRRRPASPACSSRRSRCSSWATRSSSSSNSSRVTRPSSSARARSAPSAWPDSRDRLPRTRPGSSARSSSSASRSRLATAGGHAASSGDARGASRAAPGRPAPTVTR